MRQLTISKRITQRSDDSVSRYLLDVNKYPMISADEEVELSVRIKNGDAMALEKLVVSNLRFVISVAKQYQNHGLSFSDLINEGNFGLVKAAKKFDETRGFKFISYAVWWIRQSIIQAISEQTRVVRLPLNRLTSINKIKKAIPLLEQELEREPTETEIAEYLSFKNEEVELANIYKRRQVSLDSPISQNENQDTNLYDILHNVDIPQPDNWILKESILSNIDWALKKLTEREASIITMSFGLFGSQTFSLGAIGTQYNMTSERVRQIRSSGLKNLKRLLKGKYTHFDH